MSNHAVHSFDSLAQRDPTGEVDLEDPAAVEANIRAIFDPLYGASYDSALLTKGIDDLVRAFRGDYPGLLRCDTLYHDLRHALETGLATARLLDGHEKSLGFGSPESIDGPHALLSVMLALFHDIGLLRRDTESHLWGPMLTPIHEERGVEFMSRYLAGTTLAPFADKSALIMATKLIFRMPDTWIAQDHKLASIVASADLLSQLADRCYLEKCRDFLFLEFSAFGLAGNDSCPYPDRETLLAKTPGFFYGVIRGRLDEEFHAVHRFLDVHCGGPNPWEEAIWRNLSYLQEVVSSGNLTRLRRYPKPFIDGLRSGSNGEGRD